MKTRKLRKGGMHDVNQMVISNYSPMMNKGGRKRRITRTRKRKTKRRTIRR